MKRINRKAWEHLQALDAKLTDHFREPVVQSSRIWRGDYRAIEWACGWIGESIREKAKSKGDQ